MERYISGKKKCNVKVTQGKYEGKDWFKITTEFVFTFKNLTRHLVTINKASTKIQEQWL